MQFLFLNAEITAAALVAAESSLAQQFADQAELVQELKVRAVKEFDKAYQAAQGPNDIVDNVLHILWKKLGVTFAVASQVTKQPEEWPVKVKLAAETIVLAHFWVAPAVQATQVNEVE
ncbi:MULTISPECIES: hypothetical protein [unclassified Pseudomonas]|uniref:hypothetical protein n=1 Tax=unclassified Pseudomonas TaxID=196821 RepID=UPI000A200EE7|nr:MULTISPECIES: hypothetical protein [unclassified Pseudomonas]